MANDPASEGRVPDEVSAWLSDLADERGLTEQELVERLLAGDGADAEIEPASGVVELVERMDDLEEAVADVEDALDDQIRDVRERVIQVKREADAKADADHDHANLAEGLRQVTEKLDALGHDFVDLDADVDRIEEAVEAVDERTSRGFANYEEVLEYLVETSDELNGKIDTLARAVVGLRERTGELDAAEGRRSEADRLRDAAQAHGVTSAKCEDCGETVHLGLLGSPSCPHCETTFVQLDPSRSFFRSNVLRTGRRPALEGGVDVGAPDVEAMVDAEVESPPDVDAGGSISPGSADADEGDSGEAGGPRAGDEPDDGAAVATDPAPDESGAAGPADLDVEELAGIGATYAERLREAGVETVGQLARSDPDRISERTDVGRGRVEKWIRRARERAGTE